MTHGVPRRADLLTALALEHRSLDDGASVLLDGDGGERWQRRLDAFLLDLVTHEVAEQQLVQPLVTARLEDGIQLAAERSLEEERLLELADGLRGAAHDATTLERLADLRQRFADHGDREELEVFPRLRHVTSRQELAAAERVYRVLTAQIPTRCTTDPRAASATLAAQVRRAARRLLDQIDPTGGRTDRPPSLPST